MRNGLGCERDHPSLYSAKKTRDVLVLLGPSASSASVRTHERDLDTVPYVAAQREVRQTSSALQSTYLARFR